MQAFLFFFSCVRAKILTLKYKKRHLRSKATKKVIKFENLSIQIRINLDLQTDHNKTLDTSETSSANIK